MVNFKKKLPLLLQWLYKIIYQCLYSIVTKVCPINENKAIFSLYRSQGFDGNLKAIHDELLKQKPDIQIHIIKPSNKMGFRLFKEIFNICNAKYIFLDDYYLPVYLVKPRKETSIIQLWHAAGAFKKFGYSTVGTKFGPKSEYLKIIPIHSHYTHVYVSSKYVKPYYAEAFNMSEEKIFPIGVPRIGLFEDEVCVNEIKQRLYEKMTIEQYSKVKILFAPTYRANSSQKETNFEMEDEIVQIAQNIKEDKLLIFAPHPYSKKEKLQQIQSLDNVIVTNNMTINDWMLVADAFITDYSSSIFEFGLLHKPIAHFVPDLDEYKKNRGFYNDIKDISDGDILRKSEEVVCWINKRILGETYNTDRMNHYNFSTTNHNAQKIINHLLSHS